MRNVITPYGEKTGITVPVGLSITIASSLDSGATVYQLAKSAGTPGMYRFLGTITGETTFGPYTYPTEFKISAGSSNVEYEVWAAVDGDPSWTTPTGLASHEDAHSAMGANAFRVVPGDFSSGPNILGGFSGNSIDAGIHSCIVAGGYTGNLNAIGLSFTGVNGGPNDTYVSGTADYSGVPGGYDNVCNGLASWVLSQHGRVYTAATHASIFGGSFHYVSAGDYDVICGGTLNKITSTGANNAMLGGSNQTISGSSAGCATVGGYGNTLSANYSSAIGAYSCTLSAASTAAIAAQEVSVSAVFAVGLGWQTTSYIQGGFSFGCRRHAVNGDSQAMSWHQSQSTTDAGTADLSPYGSANLVSIPINTTFAGRVFVVCRQPSTGNRAAWSCDFVASKAGSGNVIVDAQNWVELFDNITLANPAINPVGSGSFRVRCAGAAAAGSILWSSRVDVISITG